MATSSSQDKLMEELDRVAAALVNPKERRGSALRRLIGRTPLAECETWQDYRDFALVAAFEAYCARGGNPEAPDTFPWEHERERVIEWARRRLMGDMQGPHTTFGDYYLREGDRDRVPLLRWDSWAVLEAPKEGGKPGTHRHYVTREPYEPEREQALSELTSLPVALQRVLTAYEAWVLYERFCRGRTLREIARDVTVGQCPAFNSVRPRDYSGDKGFRRAEKHVQKTLERGLTRARLRLGTTWRQLAEDLQ